MANSNMTLELWHKIDRVKTRKYEEKVLLNKQNNSTPNNKIINLPDNLGMKDTTQDTTMKSHTRLKTRPRN